MPCRMHRKINPTDRQSLVQGAGINGATYISILSVVVEGISSVSDYFHERHCVLFRAVFAGVYAVICSSNAVTSLAIYCDS